MERVGEASTQESLDSLAAALLDADVLAARLGTDLEHGLAPAEAAHRHERWGPNELATAPPDPGGAGSCGSSGTR